MPGAVDFVLALEFGVVDSIQERHLVFERRNMFLFTFKLRNYWLSNSIT